MKSAALLCAVALAAPALLNAQQRGPEPPVSTRTGGDIQTRRFHALLIGVQEYSDPNVRPLTRPLADVDSVRNVLTTNYQFENRTVTVLRNPGRRAIMRSLDSLGRVLGPTDNLLIFYAGHGVWDKDLDEGFWLPADAERDSRENWISNGDIRLRVRGIRSRHTLVIADACFAGGILSVRDAFQDEQGYEQLDLLPSRLAMTSGAMTTVPDQSVFVQYLLKYLRDNRSPMVSAAKLFDRLRVPTISNSPSKQVPQFGAIHQVGHEGGDFIFLRRTAAPVAPAGTVLGAPLRTPTKFDVTAFKGTLKKIRFFGFDSVMPMAENRTFAERYDSSSANYIGTEIELSFEAPLGRTIEAPLACTYFNPDGSVFGVSRRTMRPGADWPGIVTAVGWGRDTPGVWRAGRYQVSCEADAGTFARGSFEVSATRLPTTSPIASFNANVIAMRFWEQAFEGSIPRDDRVFATSFHPATTRTIGLELELKYPAPGRKVAVPVSCTRYNPDGTVFGKQDGVLQPEPAWTGSYWTPGPWGWEQPGNHVIGRYRVECTAENRLIAVGEYEVNSPVVVPSIGARLTSLKFWEEGRDAVPLGQRKYATKFSSATTRYIGVEIGMSHPTRTGVVSIPVTCTRYWLDGTVLGVQTDTMTLQPQWTASSWSFNGYGWATPGNYKAGTYRVECSAEGNTIATGSFTVDDSTTATVPEAAPLSAVNGRVLELLVWEYVQGQQPRYATRFATSLQMLGIGLRLENPAPTRDVGIPIECTRKGPSGTVDRVKVDTLKVFSGQRNATPLATFMSAPVGGFKPGWHNVECRVDGKPVGSRTFEIAGS